MRFALHVGTEKPVLMARIAVGRQDIIVEAAVADRYFGSGIEIGAPRNDDDPDMAGAVGQDGGRRLNDGARSGTCHLDRRLLLVALLGRRVSGAGQGGHSQKRSDCGSKTDRYTHDSFWLPGFDAPCILLLRSATE